MKTAHELNTGANYDVFLSNDTSFRDFGTRVSSSHSLELMLYDFTSKYITIRSHTAGMLAIFLPWYKRKQMFDLSCNFICKRPLCGEVPHRLLVQVLKEDLRNSDTVCTGLSVLLQRDKTAVNHRSNRPETWIWSADATAVSGTDVCLTRVRPTVGYTTPASGQKSRGFKCGRTVCCSVSSVITTEKRSIMLPYSGRILEPGGDISLVNVRKKLLQAKFCYR